MRRLKPHDDEVISSSTGGALAGTSDADFRAILLALFVYRASTTWPGMGIVALGLPLYGLLTRRASREERVAAPPLAAPEKP